MFWKNKNLKMKMKKYIKNSANCLLVGVWLIANCYFLLCHEPWRDEAQTWLLARDLPFWKLPAQMSYEGHPCLWHMLIWPLVHMGLPYRMQNILAFVIVSIAVFLFTYRARLPLLIKAAAVFSPMLTYYYPVIARNYCLIPLFLFLAALWYPARFEHPWRYTLMAALLVQSHVMMVITAFSLSFCFFVSVVYGFTETDKEGNMETVLPPCHCRWAAPFFCCMNCCMWSAAVFWILIQPV